MNCRSAGILPEFGRKNTSRLRMKREIEIKLRVENPRKLKQRIKELGFERVTPRRLERNTLFDFQDRRLAHAGCALRLRAAADRQWLTFKGAARAKGKYKSRDEIETSVESGPALREILLRLGLKESFEYNKRRTVYAQLRLGRSTINRPQNLLAYDETPVGKFIELEGSPRWIDQTAAQLGYTRKDYVTASYVSLYLSGRKRN